ncbi:MAG: phosphatidylglycerophosphatase A [Coxiellaceae bacterium]|nr:phosphatidylglycerophosphatase A [Coxiellaceae bacterium]
MVWDSNTSVNDKDKLDEVAANVWRHPMYFIACGFGTGLMPILPGTFASLVGLVLFFILIKLPFWWYIASIVVVIVLSVWLSEWVIRRTGLQDPTCVCVDEVAGILVALIGVPINGWIVVAFLIFRVLDIWKPWPFGWMDKNIHGGFGMVLDDVAIGLATSIIMYILVAIFC